MSPETVPPRICSIVIDVPVQKVWDEITRTGSVQRPVYNTVVDLDLEPGGRIRYSSPDRKRVFVAGEVLEVDPPRRLRHTYIFTMSPDPVTEVTWDLEEVPGGCRVTITHAGWTKEKEAGKHAAGWNEILGLLKSELETGDIPTKTKVIYWIQGLFMFALPKTTRTEYVNDRGW
ncbi:MAG TPA: SRPBCC domain-containing protein [Longimicrobiales bacterium]|jgi:uncharacterized protein YndB with AHSA1/START domain